MKELKPFLIALPLVLGFFWALVAHAAPSISYLGNASSTAFSANVICLTADTCRTTWPSGSGSSFPFTVTGYGVSTSTTVGFTNGILSTASSTFSTLLIGNSTTTNATTTNSFVVAADGVLGSPSIKIAGSAGTNNVGLYLANTATLGLTNGTAGLSWNGSGFYPNTDDVRSLGLSTNRWLEFWGDRATTTSATSTNIYTTTASTTNFAIGGGTLRIFGTVGTALSDFCTAITGAAGLCDGSDDGGAGTSAFEVATTSDIAVPGVAYFTKTSGRTTLGSVATGTVSGTNGITVTGSRYALGGALAIDCTVASGSAAGCLASADWTTFNNKESVLTFSTGVTRSVNTVTVDQTFSPTWTGAHIFNNITRSTTTNATTTTNLFGSKFTANELRVGGSATTSIDTSGNLLVSGSTTLQNFTFVNGTGTSATTTNFYATTASTTNLAIGGGTLRIFGTVGTALSDFCTAITGGAGLCDGTDASGAGASGDDSKWATSTGSFVNAIFPNATGNTLVGIGTSTPSFQLTVSSSTRPQLSLTDGSVTSNPWTFRSAGNSLYFATSTLTTSYATSSVSAFSINANGVPTFPSVAGGLVISTAGALSSIAGTTCTNQFLRAFTVSGGTCAGADISSDTNLAATWPMVLSGDTMTFDGLQGKFATSTHDTRAINTASALTVGIGTSTPRWGLQVASSTGAQLTLSDPSVATLNHWSFRNAGGKLFVATSSPSTYATSTVSALTIDANGSVGIGTTTPTYPLSISGNIYQNGQIAHFGEQTCGTGGLIKSNLKGIEYCGSDNVSLGGVQAIISNSNTGANAWGGYTVNNNLGDDTVTHFLGLYYNGSNYTDTTFGTAIGRKSMGLLQNTDGVLALISSTSTEALNPAGIEFITGGSNTEHIRGKITHNGYWAHGTTTVTNIANTTIASSTEPQLSLSAGVGVAQWAFRNQSGNFALATTSVIGTSTSTPSAFSIQGNGGVGWSFGTSTNPVAGMGISAVGRMYLWGLTSSSGLQTGILCLSSTNEVINESVACVASDERAKNIQGNFSGALDEIDKINPILYTYKPEFNGSFQSNPNFNGLKLGLGAKALQEVDPKLVSVYTKDAKPGSFIQFKKGEAQGPDQYALITLALAGIKELNERAPSKKSLQDNWQWAAIGLLALCLVYQQRQIYKLKK